MTGGRILVVDDDELHRDLVRRSLQREGFAVDEADDGERALELVAADRPDLLVLDVNLPSLGGFDVLSRVRVDDDLPVIMLTDRGAETDRVLGLELGADDYVVKPCSTRELASRVRAVLRRATPHDARDRLDFGPLVIDRASREVHVDGEPVELTTREFDLLAFLAASPRRVWSRAQLLESVWSSAIGWQDPATVTEHVRRIRAKIERDPEHRHWIRAVRGIGYAFEP